MIDESVWTAMESAHPDGTGLVRRRVLENHPHDLFVAVDQPEQKRMLVLRVVASEVTLPSFPETRSLSISVGTTGDGLTEIRVRLEEPSMIGVFTPFIEDVIGCVGGTDSQQDAVEMLDSRIRHWKNLLSGAPDGLAAEALRGLFAELWSLRNIVAPTVGGYVAVQAWTGPEKTLRDFTFGARAIEVKSTLGRPPAAVTISSELQLSTADIDSLLLVAIEFDTAAGLNGMSLPELIDLVREIANGCAANLEERLLAAGFLESHRRHYSQPRLIIRHLHIYEVKNGFPRIVSQDIPPGIGEVSYRLSLGACEPWALEPADAGTWLKSSEGSDSIGA